MEVVQASQAPVCIAARARSRRRERDRAPAHGTRSVGTKEAIADDEESPRSNQEGAKVADLDEATVRSGAPSAPRPREGLAGKTPRARSPQLAEGVNVWLTSSRSRMAHGLDVETRRLAASATDAAVPSIGIFARINDAIVLLSSIALGPPRRSDLRSPSRYFFHSRPTGGRALGVPDRRGRVHVVGGRQAYRGHVGIEAMLQ